MNFISYFVLRAFKGETPLAQAQIETLADEIHDDAEVLDSYGFAVSPPDGLETGLCVHVQGNEDNSVVLGWVDETYRPTDLERGEVCIYSSFGQTIKLLDGGKVVIDNGGGSKITMDGGNINIESAELTHNGVKIGSTHIHGGDSDADGVTGTPQ